tara:strand:+ start:128 stop:472 length:345 start_codon:yes stop_codon:yes gene_type:complete
MNRKNIKSLAEIIKYENLHLVENEFEEYNLREFDFYSLDKTKTQGIINESYLSFVGSIIYNVDTNELGIRWKGEVPELLVLAINSHIKSRFNSKPENYILSAEGDLIEYCLDKN